MRYWLLTDKDGVDHQIMCEDLPQDAGIDVDRYIDIVEVSEFGDLLIDRLNGYNQWEPDLNVLKTAAIRSVNESRERAQQAVLTPGEAKKLVYAEKSAEVHEYFLNGSEETSRYPFAEAQMHVTGQSLREVMDEFAGGVMASTDKLAQIEALARQAIMNINDATTKEEIADAAQVQFNIS